VSSVAFGALVLVIGPVNILRPADAQVAAPTPVQLTVPAVPGQPQPFATIGALPALMPAPGTGQILKATVMATIRVFRCSCSGPGFPTAWVGTVSATNYTNASQAATGQCIGYNTNDHVPSPYIAPRQNALTQSPTFYNGTAFNSRGQVSSSAIVTDPVQAAQGQIAGECSNCACN